MAIEGGGGGGPVVMEWVSVAMGEPVAMGSGGGQWLYGGGTNGYGVGWGSVAIGGDQ